MSSTNLPVIRSITAGTHLSTQNVTFSGISNGAADAGSDADTLIDAAPSNAFTDAEVGDMVYNETDGSAALIESITDANNLEVVALVGGSGNDFASGDNYSIVTGPTPVLTAPGRILYVAIASAITDCAILLSTDFDILATGMPLRYESLAQAQPGGAIEVQVDSEDQDIYKLGSSSGHTGSNNATTLTDSAADFYKGGVRAGDILWNLTDGSWTIIRTVTKTTLAGSILPTSATGLKDGTGNDWDSGDKWRIDRAAVWLKPRLTVGADHVEYPIVVSVTEWS